MILRRLRQTQDISFALSDETLSLFRLVFFGLALARWSPGTLVWVADYPEWLRSPPPGLTQLATRVPPPFVLYAIDLGLGATALLAFLGVRTKIAGISFALLTLVHHSFVFSFGKIDHDFLAVAAVFVLSFSGWGNRFTLAELIDADHSPSTESLAKNSRALSIQFAVVAVAFFSAGLAKVRGGWLDPASQMARNWVVFYENVASSPPPLADQALRLPAAIWELTDLVTVGLEVGLLALLLLPRFTRLGVLLLIPFHVGVLVTMGIDFSGYLFIYLPFLAHPDAGRRFAEWWNRSPRTGMRVCLAALIAYTLLTRQLLPLIAGAGSRSYLPNLISFAIALLVLRWFARGPQDSPGYLGERAGSLVSKTELHDGSEVVGAQ